MTQLLLLYLSDNSTDVSQESNSRLHIVPHLLSTKVNLDTEQHKCVVFLKHNSSNSESLCRKNCIARTILRFSHNAKNRYDIHN